MPGPPRNLTVYVVPDWLAAAVAFIMYELWREKPTNEKVGAVAEFATTAQGYRLHVREPDWEQHREMKGEQPAVNLHVFTAGSREIARMLGFRDRCRNCPEERRLYEETKRRLADQVWRHVQHYANAKAEVVEAIIARVLGPTARGD